MPEEQADGRRRVVIESLSPQIDCGKYPIKRVVGEKVVVEANRVRRRPRPGRVPTPLLAGK